MSKGTDTRKHIMEIAFHLFLEKGYHGTSMAQLVNSANISKGAFYYHFKSKNAVYQAVVENYLYPLFPVDIVDQQLRSMSLGELQKYCFSTYQSSLKSLSEQLQGQNAKLFSLFFEAFQEVPEFKVWVQKFYSALKEILKTKLLEENNVQETQADKQAVSFIARFEGIIFWSAIFPDSDVAYYL